MERRDKKNSFVFQKKAQITVEYAVMFVVLVAVILVASTKFISPAVNRFFNGVGNLIDNATVEMQSRTMVDN